MCAARSCRWLTCAPSSAWTADRRDHRHARHRIEIDLGGDQTTIGLLADKVYEVTEIVPAQIEQTPRIGMTWRQEYIRCIGKRGDDFIIVLDIATMFSTDQKKTNAEIGSKRNAA